MSLKSSAEANRNWGTLCGHGQSKSAEITKAFHELKTEVNRKKPDNLKLSELVIFLRTSNCRYCHYGNFTENVHNAAYQGSYCAEYLFNALDHYKTMSSWQTYVVDGLKMLKSIVREQDWESMFKEIKTISLVISCSYYHHRNTTGKGSTELLRYLLEEGLDSNISSDAKLSPSQVSVRNAAKLGDKSNVSSDDSKNNITTASNTDTNANEHRLFEKVLTSATGISLASQFVRFGADLNAQILISFSKSLRFPTETSTLIIFDSFWDYLNSKVNNVTKSTKVATETAKYLKSIEKENASLIVALVDRRASRMRWTKQLESFGYQDADDASSNLESESESKSNTDANTSVCTSTYVIHPLFSLAGVMDIAMDYANKSWKNDDAKTSAAHKTLTSPTR